jgi:hypothetical protein
MVDAKTWDWALYMLSDWQMHEKLRLNFVNNLNIRWLQLTRLCHANRIGKNVHWRLVVG